MSPIDHIFLYCILYLVAEIYERNARAKLPIFKIALIFCYAITEGLRYGRGVDQNSVYGPEYLKSLSTSMLRENMEPLYVLILKTTRSIDPFVGFFPWGSIFIVYALIFILCLLRLHTGYVRNTKHFILFALLATLTITEWPIRTGVGFSFMLPAIYYLGKVNFEKWATDKNLRLALLFLIIPPLIHKGDALGSIFIFLFCILFNKKPISLKISLPIFLILEFSSFPTRIMETLYANMPVLNFTSDTSGHFQHYLDYSNFQNEVEQGENGIRSPFTQFLAIGYYISIISVGYIVCKTKKTAIWIYNLFVFSIMISEPFRLLGSLIRMFSPTSVLWFIPMSMAAFYYKELRANKYFKYCYCFFIAYLIIYYGRFVFVNPTAKYVWSSGIM